MPTKATQAAMDARSLWVIAAQSAASTHRAGLGARRCETRTGAMRIRALFPADRAAASGHSRPALFAQERAHGLADAENAPLGEPTRELIDLQPSSLEQQFESPEGELGVVRGKPTRRCSASPFGK
jgi:hypothetical protein